MVSQQNATTTTMTNYFDFFPLPLNSASSSSSSSSSSVPPPLAAIDSDSERAYCKSKLDLGCAAALNQQFNAVNNTQSNPPIPNTNVFQFTTKITNNSDEAKCQRRKQANIESAKRSRKRKQDLMKNLEKEVEVLKNTALESSQVRWELKEKCDKAHFENRIAIIDYVTKRLLVYKTELQLMRVTGCHPLNDPVFISMANDAGLNLSDVRRSLLYAPTYPSKVGMQQVQNQNFPHTGLHRAMPGWGNNQQNNY